MGKNRSIVYIQYKSGSKPKGIRVSLSISDGLLRGGTTKTVYTDKDGRAIIEHSSTGKATVYVSGSKKGIFRVPGETVVFI